MPKVCISASGKVLISGGYLILERPNVGLSVAVTSRFYTTIDRTPLRDSSQASSASTRREGCIRLHVLAPQFLLDNNYEYVMGTAALQSVRSEENASRYIEVTIRTVLAVLEQLVPSDQLEVATHQLLVVTILADNDFYSQREQLSIRGLTPSRAHSSSLPKFLRPTSRAAIRKTGLGSSAALVTSLVGALLAQFNLLHLQPTSARRAANTAREFGIVHNLAQYCHALAQESVGSGFDVCTAVYGSGSYMRFAPGELTTVVTKKQSLSPEGLINIILPENSVMSMNQAKMVWNQQHKAFALPPGLNLILGDVEAGSSTPKLVSSVLQWKQANAKKAEPIWGGLAKKNTELIENLEALNKYAVSNTGAYNEQLAACGRITHDLWAVIGPVGELLTNTRNIFQGIRQLLREMGASAGVDIEPATQTALIDATISLPGVVVSGVPGAGGNDAVFAIVIGDAAIANVDSLWLDWKDVRVTPLLARESRGGLEWAQSPV